jgi:ABC-2 type transport system permease protein
MKKGTSKDFPEASPSKNNDFSVFPKAAGLYCRKLAGLVRKESLQAMRDPSTILIAFILPIILLFLFAYAVSLDVDHIRIGVVLESDSAEATELAAAFAATSQFSVTPARDRRQLTEMLNTGDLRGMIIIGNDFEKHLQTPQTKTVIQVICDGVSPNTAKFIAGYAQGILSSWNNSRLNEKTANMKAVIQIQPRYWFNPEIESRRFLIPGAIAIVMTMIGTLLTALVIAREWERGTMEALLSTPISVSQILLGKIIPYFFLGLAATLFCTLLAVYLFKVPLRGSWFALFCLSSSFLVPALGQGLMISTLTKNQFIASQAALFSGFLPAFMLSGFLYEIQSMPWILQVLSHIIPARYFVASLQTVFLTGDVWSQFLPGMTAMLAVGALFFTITVKKTYKHLDFI